MGNWIIFWCVTDGAQQDRTAEFLGTSRGLWGDVGAFTEGRKPVTHLRSIQQAWKDKNAANPFEKREAVRVKSGPCCKWQLSALLGTAAWPSSLGTEPGLDQEMIFSVAQCQGEAASLLFERTPGKGGFKNDSA